MAIPGAASARIMVFLHAAIGTLGLSGVASLVFMKGTPTGGSHNIPGIRSDAVGPRHTVYVYFQIYHVIHGLRHGYFFRCYGFTSAKYLLILITSLRDCDFLGDFSIAQIMLCFQCILDAYGKCRTTIPPASHKNELGFFYAH